MVKLHITLIVSPHTYKYSQRTADTPAAHVVAARESYLLPDWPTVGFVASPKIPARHTHM